MSDREQRSKSRSSQTSEPGGSAVPAKAATAFGLQGAPKSEMPRNIKPMLATAVAGPFDGPDWLFEIKWDGYRAIAEVEGANVRLYSRNKLSFVERYASIVDSLKTLGHDAVLDGEIVVLDKTGKSQFQLLQGYQKSRRGMLVYYVFDLLYLDGHDLRDLPLARRKELLAQLIAPLTNVKLSEHIAQHGKAFFQAVAQQQLEGMVAKDRRSRYRPGVRSKSWLKVRTHLRQEVVIGGFTKPRGSRAKIGALVLGVYEGKDLIYAGCAGTGLSERTLIDLYARLEPLIQSACPFKKRPETNSPATWVEPRLVCEVNFQSWTDDGHMRFPVFVGLREDIPADSVRRETIGQ